MSVTRLTQFEPGDRYRYDWHVCTAAKGWAQLDTRQDASYYGNWVNPEKRMLFSYAEGDCTLTTCETEAEFQDLLREVLTWHEKNDGKKPGLDPGFNPDLTSRLEALGFAAWMGSVAA